MQEYIIYLAIAAYFSINGYIAGTNNYWITGGNKILNVSISLLIGLPVVLILLLIGLLQWIFKKPIDYIGFWYNAKYTDKFKELPKYQIERNEKYFKDSKGWKYLKKKYNYNYT